MTSVKTWCLLSLEAGDAEIFRAVRWTLVVVLTVVFPFVRSRDFKEYFHPGGRE